MTTTIRPPALQRLVDNAKDPTSEERPVLEKWRDALRSGLFRQGRKLLVRYKDGQSYHCCLGVLSTIMDYRSDGVLRYPDAHEKTDLYDWFGVQVGSGEIIGCFIQANDVDKASFEEIADAIDAILSR